MISKIGNGKVREIYDLGDCLILVTTDRVSAFDCVLGETIPFKGVVLNKLSAFWFNLTKDICPNHMLSIDDNDMPPEFMTPERCGCCMLVEKLKMLPIEAIVRGYITGSGWKSYQKNGSVCGIKLPDGLRESEKLPEALYTPTTKAAIGEHDEHITFDETCNLIGTELATKVRDKSIELYTTCAEYARKRGIIIADTKFEFGVTEDGELVLADEMLTPDSSRFWPADKYEVGRSQESFDKQYIRDWLAGSGWNKQPPAPQLPHEVICKTGEKYLQAYHLLTDTK